MLLALVLCMLTHVSRLQAGTSASNPSDDGGVRRLRKLGLTTGDIFSRNLPRSPRHLEVSYV